METTTTTITLSVRGDGTALELKRGVSTFGLVKVQADRGTVMWTPDTDNEGNTTFWVQGIESPVGVLPEGVATLTLTYAGE